MLTESIISLFDLAEAEGRLLRQKVIQTVTITLLMFVSALMLLAAMGLLVTAIYHALLNWLPLSGVYLVMALASFLLAGGLLWVITRINHKQ
jgi:hypothetical protein